MNDDQIDYLEVLRELQDGARRERPMTFAEWSVEQDRRFNKGPGPISPGLGMIGHLNTSSNAPTGPRSRPSGNQATGLKQTPQQFGVPSGAPTYSQRQSQYSHERPNQPAPWIDDVDMASTWYSPFQPVWPFGPPFYTRPREWNYPVGYNLNYIPERMSLNEMLRGMRRSWGVLATVESTRMDQLLRIPWTIQRRDKPRAQSTSVAAMRKFFKKPDGRNSFAQWTRKLLFDSFDIDFPVLYVDRGVGLNNEPQAIEVLDGGTIFPLIDDSGRRPGTAYEIHNDGIVYEHRQPAYQQIIYGLPMLNLSEDEVINPIIRPQPDMPMFGYSPIEQFLQEITEAIRKTFYQKEFWRSGSMPELIVTVPDAWTPRQIATFQAHFDALLSGQLTLKSKVRFVPGGMKPFDIKNASGESLWSQRDELLVRLCCYAFSVSPTPFIRQMNRATAQNAQQTAQEEGLYPLMAWFKDDIMDRIIQEVFGYDDTEFTYLPRPEVDQEKQSKILQVYVDEGIRTRNSAREELGEEPIEGGDILTVKTGAGVVPLSMVLSGEALATGTPKNESGDGKAPSKSPPPAGGSPQRGPARPNEASPQPSPVHKWMAKVSNKDVREAASESEGDIDRVSHLQRKVGNYKKGHIWIQGLNISIENEKGSWRGEKDVHGKSWQVKMPCPYGYIRGTIGADNMQVDCYLGKKPKSTTVWVVDQDKVTPEGENKGFDEHKVMLGYKDLKKALSDYLKTHFDGLGHERLFAVTELQMPEFKLWLLRGNMKEAISKQGVGEVVLRRDSVSKADTISTSTNLTWYSQPRAKKRRKKRLARGPRWLQLGAA